MNPEKRQKTQLPHLYSKWSPMIISCLAVYGAAAMAASPPAVSFAPPRTYAVAAGSGVSCLVTGDLNRDGAADLAVTRVGGIQVLLGNRDGTFQGALTTDLGFAPQSLVLGDFNRDGKLDLAGAQLYTGDPLYPGFGCIWILLGYGDGTFQSPVSYPAGYYCSSLAVDDVNEDGKLDLAVTSITTLLGLVRPGDVVILIGNGDGTFHDGGAYEVGSDPACLHLGDFNKDGRTDMAVANGWDRNVTVFLGNGNATFVSGATYATGGRPASIAGGDLNADGERDLAILNFDTADVAVLLGAGDGTFFAATNYVAGSNNCFSIAMSDFNKDETPDLAVADMRGARIPVLLGRRDGTFQAPVHVPLGVFVESVAVGDFNRDGRPDVASSAYGTVLVLLNTTGDPQLDILRRDGLMAISWPFPSAGFLLESSTNLLSTNWQSAIEMATTNQGNWEMRIVPNEPARYFRLRKRLE